MSPDQGAHTTFPIFGVPIPGFQGHQALRKRDLLLVVSEAARADNCGRTTRPISCCKAAPRRISRSCSISRRSRRRGRSRRSACRRRKATTVDEAGASAHTRPLNRSIRRRTARSRCSRGSTRACAFGIFAIRLPFTRSPISFRRRTSTVPTCANAETKEGGEFGTETATSKCKSAGVINNVEIDDRGLIYGADRAGGGLHILRLTGYAGIVVTEHAGRRTPSLVSRSRWPTMRSVGGSFS